MADGLQTWPLTHPPPALLPVESNCQWSRTASPQPWDAPRAERGGSNILRLLSPGTTRSFHCFPVGAQWPTDKEVQAGLGCQASVGTERGSCMTPQAGPAVNHPAERQPTHRIVRNVAGRKISISALTFQGQEETQKSDTSFLHGGKSLQLTSSSSSSSSSDSRTPSGSSSVRKIPMSNCELS